MTNEVPKDEESPKIVEQAVFGEDGFLHRYMTGRKQLVLPTKYSQLALEHLHDRMGHIGQERVINLMRESFYWPHMKREVEEYIPKRCTCIKAKKQ